MPLDPAWWANTPGNGKFPDNTDGAITAGTLREFALDLALTGIALDYLTYTSDTMNMGAPYVFTNPSEAETVYLQGGGVGYASDNWSHLANSNGQEIFSYSAGLDVLLTVANVKSTVVINGATAGTKAELVLWTGSGVTPDDSAAAVISPTYTLAGGNNTFPLLSSASSIPLPSSVPSISIGIRLTPPSGQAISAGSLAIDLDNFQVVLVARPSAPVTLLT